MDRKLPTAEIVTKEDGGIRIGAMARNTDVAYNPVVSDRYPVLSIEQGLSSQYQPSQFFGEELQVRRGDAVSTL